MSRQSQGHRGNQMLDLLGMEKISRSSDKSNNQRDRTLKRKYVPGPGNDQYSKKYQKTDTDFASSQNLKCRYSERVAQRMNKEVETQLGPEDKKIKGHLSRRAACRLNIQVEPEPEYEKIKGNKKQRSKIKEDPVVEAIREKVQTTTPIPLVEEVTVSELTPMEDLHSSLQCSNLELIPLSLHETSAVQENITPYSLISAVQEKYQIEIPINTLRAASKCPTLKELSFHSLSVTYLVQGKTAFNPTTDNLFSVTKATNIKKLNQLPSPVLSEKTLSATDDLHLPVKHSELIPIASSSTNLNNTAAKVPKCAKHEKLIESSTVKENALNETSQKMFQNPEAKYVSPALTHVQEQSVDITETDISSKNLFKSIRSLSLSDLTEDKKNDYSVFRRSKSVTMSDSLFCLESPSLISFLIDTPALDEDNDAAYEASIDNTAVGGGDENITVDYGDLDEGRKRSCISNPETWKKKRAQKMRMLGEEYLGFRKTISGKVEQDVLKPQRVVGPICESEFCKKSKLRGCNRFTEETRRQINEKFWKSLNWDQRKIYVTNLVSRTATSRKTSDENSKREGTLKYFLPLKANGEEKIQVCREMFLSTLSLGSFTVQSWVKNASYMILPNKKVINASVSNIEKTNPEMTRKLLTLDNFLNNLPKLPSHYARKNTNKLFIEPAYQTITELFNAYKKYCSENEEPHVSRYTFDEKFRKKNLSIYQLKKDMCDVCASHKAGNLSETDYQAHIIKKNRARLEKEADKEKATKGEFILLTLDLEAVKVCPYLTASALYFKTKLTCHNYTIYDLVTNHCSCYWFNETEADLTSSTFSSFLIDYLEKHCLDRQLPIMIYSDGCTYQNRNVILANALLNFSKTHGVTIVHKYLEPGHTQMECDSVHSAIERKLKNKEIYLPSDYVKLTKEARIKNPYETICVDYTFVKNYADTKTHVYKTIRPGRKAGDPQVVDIRAILYKPDLTIKVKLDFDSEWIDLPLRPKQIQNVEYRQLHSCRIPISKTKYNHLQQLKVVIPNDCHGFYDSLPFVP